MKSHRIFGAALAAPMCLFSTLALAQSGPQVWVAPPLQRVGPSDSAGSGAAAQIWAAKGEYESFQIVVRAPAGGLSNINVTVSDLYGPGGAVIPRSSFTLYREHFVYVSSSSPNWGGSNRPLSPGWYADGLIPFNDPVTGLPLAGASLDAVPFSLNANQNQPIWVDLLVPRTAAPGQYIGTFTVQSNQGATNGTVSLRVWNFALPVKPALKSSFLLWQSDSLLAQKELLKNRLSPLRTNPVDQRSLIDNLGLAGVGLPFWSGADIGNCTMSAAPSVTQFQASAALQQSDLVKFDYSADEIGNCTNLHTTVKQWARNMHQAGVKNLITMAPTPALLDDGSGTGRSAVDIWVMLPIHYDNARAYVGQALQKGDWLWSYNTLVQDSYSPKWLIDFLPINFRIQPGFINQSLNLSGLLYWRTDLWSSNAWNNVNNAGTFASSNYPGEGLLVYPGQPAGIQGVAPSMRLKWLRDGVDDYDYVALLKGLGRGDWALQLSRSVGADWVNWTRDAATLEMVRRQLGDEIERMTAPPPPSAPTNPSPANGATGVSITPTLSWAASSAATSYDVYFGTSSAPPLVRNTTGASYAPGTLAYQTTYYWRVVAKNSRGTASSATWSFRTASAPSSGGGGTNVAPTAVTVSPSSGSGRSVPFQFTYADANGAADLAGGGVLINSSLSGTRACWFYYEAATRRLWLANDTAASWSSATLGSATLLSNSQCIVDAFRATATAAGNNLTLGVPVTFQSGFTGAKTVYLYSQDRAGLSSGYQARGTWTVQ